MDLLDILKSEMAKVPEGEHSIGLRSVIRHIEVGFSHLSRGQSEKNSNAFTDTIYRTNQAFEGSVKESYRVLANKDPSNKSIFEIEKYLTDNNILRQRILTLFSNYRTDWRNPSTHDYNLDFDEAEAFLAIVSISAFTKLLLDQIIEKIAYQSTLAEASEQDNISIIQYDNDSDLTSKLRGIIIKFSNYYAEKNHSKPIESESQLIGMVTGFIAAADPDVKIVQDYPLRGRRWRRADLVAEKNGKNVVIEVKMGKNIDVLIQSGVDQLRSYADSNQSSSELILFVFSPEASIYKQMSVSDSESHIVNVIYPQFGQDEA